MWIDLQKDWINNCLVQYCPKLGHSGYGSYLLHSLVFIYLFFLLMAVLGLRFCARAFSSCGKWGPLFIAVRGPLTISRPLLLRSTGSRRAGSAIAAHGPSRSVACGIFPDRGSNPCPLHWQADSQPLRHQGSPPGLFRTLNMHFYRKFLHEERWFCNLFLIQLLFSSM